MVPNTVVLIYLNLVGIASSAVPPHQINVDSKIQGLSVVYATMPAKNLRKCNKFHKQQSRASLPLASNNVCNKNEFRLNAIYMIEDNMPEVSVQHCSGGGVHPSYLNRGRI